MTAAHRARLVPVVGVGLAVALLGAGCQDDEAGSARPSSTTSSSPARVPRGRTLTVADPLRVLVVGDSVMFDAAPAIEAALHSGGTARVTTQAVLGSGLAKGNWDWRREWPALVERTDAEAAVVLAGAWDLLTEEPGPSPPPGTPAWVVFYRPLLLEALDLLTAGGAHVYWVGMPWVGEDAHRQSIATLNRLLEELAAARADVTFVDGAAVLAGPGGSFTVTLPGDDGQPVRVRKADGVHLCPAGAARLADAIVTAVTAAWPLRLQPGWEDGSWRDDERYRWERGGGCPPA